MKLHLAMPEGIAKVISSVYRHSGQNLEPMTQNVASARGEHILFPFCVYFLGVLQSSEYLSTTGRGSRQQKKIIWLPPAENILGATSSATRDSQANLCNRLPIVGMSGNLRFGSPVLRTT